MTLKLTAAPPVYFIGIDQGLSNNAVRCIFKDNKGFMWFGTYDGLNRYDGYGFKIFRNKVGEPTSLINNYIFSIAQDQSSNMWIGTHGGACIYDDFSGKFSPVNYFDARDKRIKKIPVGVRVVKSDGQGNMLLGTLGMGLLVCQKPGAAAKEIPLTVSGRLVRSYDVQAIKISRSGKIWIFVPQFGLCLLEDNKKLVLINGSLKNAFCIEPQGDNVWIGTGDGLFLYQAHSGEITKVLDQNIGKLTFNKVSDMILDDHQQLWMAINGGGINIYNILNHRLTYLKDENNNSPLSNDAAYTLIQDEDKRIWIGTLNGGVNVIDPQKDRFKTIASNPATTNSLPKKPVYALYEDLNGDLWIGTEGGGLVIWDRRANVFRRFTADAANPHALSDNIVTSIVSDYKNEIWEGTFFGGINRYIRATGQFEHYRCINPGSGVENKVVSTMCEDGDRNLWAGTLKGDGINGALYKFDRLHNKFNAFDTNLSDLSSLTADREGNLWAGTLTQLIKIDRTNKKHKFFELDYYIRCIFEDRERRLWVGTEGGGLVLFDRKRSKILARFTTEDGLCNNAVLNILEDKSGNLWVSTFNGLSKFNPQTKSFKSYYKSDGIQSNQFHYNSNFALRSGELAFGGIEGLNLFYPEKVKDLTNVPKLVLSGVTVNNVPLEKDAHFVKKATPDGIKQIEVPYDQAVFAFQFTALEFTAPGKIHYAYFLENWDHTWTNSGNIRYANYTHLNEGKYILHIKCTNAEGQWLAKQISLEIIVLPPWYASWWAYTCYLLILITCVYWYLAYRSRETRLKYEIKLAKVNADNQKVLQEKEREMNEKRLEFFTGISHEFRTPLSLIINPVKDLLNNSISKDRNDLNIVYRNARRLLSLVDQLLLFRKADASVAQLNVGPIHLVQVCKEVFLCFVQQAKISGISYEFSGENEDLVIYGDREKIEIILYNLISNAIKYTPAGKAVNVIVEESSEEAVIKVVDQGYGIPPEVGDKLFDKFYRSKEAGQPVKAGFGIGLYLAKQFTGDHQGTLTYLSVPGNGTTFTLMLKKGILHYSPEIISVFESASSELLNELTDGPLTLATLNNEDEFAEFKAEDIFTDKKAILIIDDDTEIRHYIKSLLEPQYVIYDAADGDKGLVIAREKVPDLIICDVMMPGLNGIELCAIIKQDPLLSYIPMILLTASSSPAGKLKGLESGADDYISKPFEKDILIARVANLLQIRRNLQRYFYSAVTLKSTNVAISEEYKQFLEKCIEVVEKHLTDHNFNINMLASEIGMSRSNLFRKVKSLSGHSINSFIRYIRLRKAAELLIQSDMNINEVALETGFNNIKYFRTQFFKLFGANPSDFLRQKRPVFKKRFNVIN
ncbi:two-component regulator propeller domain-containing protein [Mucilaginibacter sp.]|uniref:two-component regulator propeller domain-containing protein n=1 Tax=Mucilaginibacter sp. TaxID=1882438 RepID=UPI00356746A1